MVGATELTVLGEPLRNTHVRLDLRSHEARTSWLFVFLNETKINPQRPFSSDLHKLLKIKYDEGDSRPVHRHAVSAKALSFFPCFTLENYTEYPSSEG